jgi:serine/threonine protein kinase
VVHGDLKAANVLLMRGGEDPGGLWARNLGYRVTAKVADFGLALSLDPKDTHATMAARVSRICRRHASSSPAAAHRLSHCAARSPPPTTVRPAVTGAAAVLRHVARSSTSLVNS